MKKTSLFVLMISLLLFILPLYGCQRSSQSDVIELRFAYWGTLEEHESRQKIIDQFNNDHLGSIHVECIHIPDDYDTKLYTMVASNNAPDVLMVDTASNWVVFSKNDKLVNLESYINNDASFSMDNLLNGLGFYWGDSINAIGNEPQVVSLYYNTELFSEFKISPPSCDLESPSTWEEIIYKAQLLTIDKDGNNALSINFDPDSIVQYGINISMWYVPLQSIIMSNGGDYLTKDGKDLGLLEPESIEALQMISDLINVYHVMPTPAVSEAFGSTSTSLANGKIAMLIDGHWVHNRIAAQNEKFNVAPIPAFGDKQIKTWFGTSGLSIFSSCEHPQAAWELVKYLLTEGGNEQVVLDGVCLPVLKTWYNDKTIYNTWSTYGAAHPSNYTLFMKDYVLEHSVPSVTLRIKNFSGLDEACTAALERAWNNEVSVEQALMDSYNEIKNQIEGWNSDAYQY